MQVFGPGDSNGREVIEATPRVFFLKTRGVKKHQGFSNFVIMSEVQNEGCRYATFRPIPVTLAKSDYTFVLLVEQV